MHQQAAAADGVAEAGDPADHIQQQGDGLGVAAGALAQPLGQLRDAHPRHAPGVGGHNGWLIALGDDKHAVGAGAMGLLAHLHQPGGLLLGAAAEAGELVTGRQQLRRAVAAYGWC